MLIGYHGTTTQNAKNIIASGKFLGSTGNRHWLGDGVYFFSEEIHAYVWNRNHHKKRKKTVDHNELRRHYAILYAEINSERIFDLDTAEHKLIFEEAYRKARLAFDKLTDPHNGFCAEGVIINLMFTHMGFANDFDLVAATFLIKINRYENFPLSSRLPGIPQRQICVKNCSIINNTSLHDISNRIADLELKAAILEARVSWNYDSTHKIHYKT